MAVVSDLIEEASLSEDENGIVCTRKFLVTEIGGGADVRLYNARQAVGVSRGDFHPSIPGIQADTFNVSPCGQSSNAQFKVTINYKALNSSEIIPDDAAPAQLRVSATVQQVNANTDINGDTLLVYHTGSAAVDSGDVRYDADEFDLGVRKEQTAEISIQVPQAVFSFSRRETRDPGYKAIAYVGKVNAGSFRGDPPGIWLCTRIEGDSPDNGKTWNVSYEFQRNEQTWVGIAYYINTNTGKPYPEATWIESDDVRYFQMYAEVDFGPLGVG